jgi:hypothetical protein
LVVGFGTFFVFAVERVECVVCVVCFLVFDLDFAGAFALAVDVAAAGDSTPEETRDECFVR